jgi:ABC-type uncharacterized transport system auxiliary subunit
MHVNRRVRLTAVLLIALLVGACGTSDTLPEDRFYRLASLTTGSLERRLLDGPLLVESISTYDVYRDRAMAFSPPDEPGSLQHHHYHFWVAPPPELVHEQLVDYLRQSGIATEVAANRSGRIRPAARLASRLTRFERVLHADGGVEVAVALEFTLRWHQAGRRRVLPRHRARGRSGPHAHLHQPGCRHDRGAGCRIALIPQGPADAVRFTSFIAPYPLPSSGAKQSFCEAH